MTAGLYDPHTINIFLKYFHLFWKGCTNIFSGWNHWLIEGKGQWSPKPQIIAVTAAYIVTVSLAQLQEREEKIDNK